MIAKWNGKRVLMCAVAGLMALAPAWPMRQETPPIRPSRLRSPRMEINFYSTDQANLITPRLGLAYIRCPKSQTNVTFGTDWVPANSPVGSNQNAHFVRPEERVGYAQTMCSQ